ncbi:PEP-CTERM sorting domain-containing protein [Herbaspirillum sp. NPDC087042]|uniref:PEP-CTERM sorting domain-containing protein n=1 Tax=Herbaspirillum sp. NPDC087042 TaxID=3364004 RepID=UPI003804234D
MTLTKRLLALISFALAFCMPAAHANTVTIDGTWYSNTQSWSITFTGNADGAGNINLANLTALSFSDSDSQTFSLGNVNAFGTFNVNTNVWSSNAADWFGNLDAFLTSNYFGSNFGWSLANGWDYFPPVDSYTVVRNTGGTVPEPMSLALMALGLVALRASRRQPKAA